MLRRHVLRSKPLTAVASRSYRTKGAVGKAKADGGDKNEKKSVKMNTIAHGSDQHNDLSSFLDYATRLELAETSTVYVGTHYEYTVSSSLQSLGFHLTRTGRASDYGIDLLGHWSVSSLPKPIRVLLQCKAHNKGLTPANVRELEGAFPGAPAGWRGGGVLGFLVATNQATKGIREALIRSHLPMGFLQVTAEGTVLQFIWNHEAAQQGLEGMGVTIRFTPQTQEKERDGNGLEQEIALTWKGWTLSKGDTLNKENTEIAVQKAEPKAKSRAAKSPRTTKSVAKDKTKTGKKDIVENILS
ncbi:endonuclease resolvase hjc trna endonuclease [Venturia nashicola]|uniref:Endonuclease resolvase hjc trna endonuclease n=1 Tax=Venturia nashicola TaxID=86259 RepID=A0A4Z1PEE4_9PEZI|nr:endonuclease resolvase hjc trna endonuclease [Venturia nashicola]